MNRIIPFLLILSLIPRIYSEENKEKITVEWIQSDEANTIAAVHQYQWLDNNLPAFVEGSDPKKIEEIGRGKKSYIKIGDYNFEAVKFALQDKKNRVSDKIPKRENSFIKSVSFDGGKLDGQTIELSASMNNFVGVRGSGKSSIIEAIRYGLGLEFSKNSVDIDYKNNLKNCLEVQEKYLLKQ